MVEYVIGVAFDTVGAAVVVLKKRPVWQRGLLNFPGGKIEPGETPQQAIEREYLEEVGMRIPADSWEHFATMQEEGRFRVYCLRCLDHLVESVLTDAQYDEPVVSLRPETLAERARFGKAVENLAWILYLAMDTNQRKDPAIISYSDKAATDAKEGTKP